MSALAVQGVSSWAGKSLVTTALARAFKRRGIRVAPFKAQNMSNNARVVDGGEIGVAQYLQALAAGVSPDVRMNPILVKPEADDRSQVIVLGKVDRELSRTRWIERPSSLWPVARAALTELLAEYDLVLLEGAGSPAETNLRATDLANMRSAHHAHAPVLLVADIDRGGAFAHLHGTWSLVTDSDRALIHGFVLNRFRGDERLLGSAPAELERTTGMRYVGVLPYVRHGLPDEDGAAPPTPRPGAPRVGIVRYPTASNLDEFKPLEQVVDVAWVTAVDELDGCAVVVLPGSKHVAADLDWLRAVGLADRVVERANARMPVVGICGGFQMLGARLDDPGGVDGARPGLGLLAVETVFREAKRTERVVVDFGELGPPFAGLSGLTVPGYEIRHGETRSRGRNGGAETVVLQQGSVLGLTAHGVLGDATVLRALFGGSPSESLDAAFDQLGDLVEERLDVPALLRVAGIDG